MQPFSYSAYGPDGRKTFGEIQANSRDEAFRALNQRNLTPISISDGVAGDATSILSLHAILDRLFHDPLLIVRSIRMLAILISRHVAVPTALELTADMESTGRGKRVLKSIGARVAEGQSLSSAMAASEGFASPYILSLISSGENTATLGEVLEMLAGQLEKEQEIRRKVKSAFAYPMLLVFASLSMLAFMAFYMVPTLMPLLEQGKGEVPTLLFLMNKGATYVSENTLFVALVSVLIISLLAAFPFSKTGKVVIEEILFRLPVVRKMLAGSETIRFCNSLGMMLRHHVELVRALEIAQGVVKTAYFSNAIRSALPALKEGQSLDQAFATFSRLPKTFFALARAGGETRALPDALAQISDVERAVLDKQVETAVKLLPPVLTLLVGSFVGTFVLVIVDAIMSLNDAAF